MAKGFKGPGMGRPPIEWSEEKIALFHNLMGIPFVTEEAICDILKVSDSSLTRWLKKTYRVTFEELKKQKHSGMKLKLAGKQYELAMKGNPAMLVWLGKQWLHQSDKIEQKQDISISTMSDEELEKIVLEAAKTIK
jgi:ParB-like chromosome segregation protein Spo0J